MRIADGGSTDGTADVARKLAEDWPVRVNKRVNERGLATAVLTGFGMFGAFILLPQFAAGILPNGLTVHGFGEDSAGELYAMVTNTPANGSGGIVYKFTAIPEPATLGLAGAALLAAASRRRRSA